MHVQRRYKFSVPACVGVPASHSGVAVFLSTNLISIHPWTLTPDATEETTKLNTNNTREIRWKICYFFLSFSTYLYISHLEKKKLHETTKLHIWQTTILFCLLLVSSFHSFSSFCGTSNIRIYSIYSVCICIFYVYVMRISYKLQGNQINL